jgi:hypothetical protein
MSSMQSASGGVRSPRSAIALDADLPPPLQPCVPTSSLSNLLRRMSAASDASSTTDAWPRAKMTARAVALKLKWSPYAATSAVWLDTANSSGLCTRLYDAQ